MAPEILDGSNEWKRGTPRAENPGVDAWAAGAVIVDWLIGTKYNAIGGLEPRSRAWRTRPGEQVHASKQLNGPKEGAKRLYEQHSRPEGGRSTVGHRGLCDQWLL